MSDRNNAPEGYPEPIHGPEGQPGTDDDPWWVDIIPESAATRDEAIAALHVHADLQRTIGAREVLEALRGLCILCEGSGEYENMAGRMGPCPRERCVAIRNMLAAATPTEGMTDTDFDAALKGAGEALKVLGTGALRTELVSEGPRTYARRIPTEDTDD